MSQELQIIAVEDTWEPYVGQWRRLVSTTNWEKGRIIHEWRRASITARVPPSEYSDEAWARRVGGATSQHIGRLRRVYERFGQVYDQFEGLYWSHFQAAIDWDDAEMWLEGAIQNGWSVALMRQHRWQTLGAVKEDEPQDDVTTDVDEDAIENDTAIPVPRANSTGTADHAYAEARSPAGPDFGEDDYQSSGQHFSGEGLYLEESERPTIPPVRPFENLPELPDDMADAYESLKLTILRHKANDWQSVSRDAVLASLDALKVLVMADAPRHVVP
jgi:hypothetical protein